MKIRQNSLAYLYINNSKINFSSINLYSFKLAINFLKSQAYHMIKYRLWECLYTKQY
jgi:hypothetical protein